MADVRLPNGVVIRNVPEGITQAELQKRAIAGGYATQEDFQPTQQAEQPQQVEQQPVQQPSLMDRTIGGLEAAAAVASGIVAEPISGVFGLTAAAVPGGLTGAEAVEAGREALTFQPRTEIGQAAVQEVAETFEPLTEALQNLEQRLGDYTFSATESPTLAALATALPTAALEIAGAGVGRRAAQQTGTRQVRQEAGDRAVQEIEQAESETGVRQMTSDVLPPETRAGRFMQQQGELVAGGQRSAQQAERLSSIERTLQNFEVEEGARYESSIVQGIRDSIDADRARLGEMYDNSSAQLNTMGQVPLSNTRRLAEDFIAAEQRKGSLADQSSISDMQNLLDAPGDLTFEEVKSIRSSVGDKLQKVRRGAPVTGSADEALLKRIYSRLSEDMTNFARQTDEDLFNQWKEADAEYSDFATGASNSKLRRVIRDGDVNPEIVDQLLFSNRKSDVDYIADNLTEAGKQAAKQRVLQLAFDRANALDEGINVNTFNRQISKLDNQIGAIFTPEEATAIKELNRILTRTRRAQDATVTTPTGQQLVPFLSLTAPWALIPGVMQAAVETSSIRNLLVRRRAAKDAVKIRNIDRQLEREIERSGLLGAAATGSATESQQTLNQNQEGN